MPTSLFPALQEQWNARGIPGEKPRDRVLTLWLFKKYAKEVAACTYPCTASRHTSVPQFVSIPHQAESSFCLESLQLNV